MSTYLQMSEPMVKFLANNPGSFDGTAAEASTSSNKVSTHLKRYAKWYIGGLAVAAILIIIVLAVLLTRAKTTNNGLNTVASATNGVDATCTTPPIEEGPYFVDEKINSGDLYNTSIGLLLGLTFPIYNSTSTQCNLIIGAQVDIWSADYMGLYSDEQSEGTLGKKWLRGYQVTDKSGQVTFKTLYPGYYSSRTVHLHVMVRLYDSTGKQTFRGTSQLYFDDALTDQVYKLAPYNTRPARSVRNNNDRIFTQVLVLPLIGSLSDGYTATMPISVPFTK